MTIESQRCSRCKEVRQATEFRKNRSTSTGLSAWCKPCLKAYDQLPHNREVKAKAQRHYMVTHHHVCEQCGKVTTLAPLCRSCKSASRLQRTAEERETARAEREAERLERETARAEREAARIALVAKSQEERKEKTRLAREERQAEAKRQKEARDKKFEAPPGYKVCRKCLEVKVLTDFYRNSGTSDGRNSWCKLCINADSIIRTRLRRARS